MSRSRIPAGVVVLLLVAAVGGCSPEAHGGGGAAPSTRLFYDSVGRLEAVRDGGTTAVYRYDEAGDRVAVDHVRSRDFHAEKVRDQPAPRVTGLTHERVAQGATIAIRGTGFAPAPMGDVVSVGGALGRVVSATPNELRVQLPPAATPGPVTVSTAAGRSTSRGRLVVVPAEVEPADVSGVVQTSAGHTATLPVGQEGAGLRMLTFHGTAGSTARLRLSGDGGCDSTDVGLAGPTGTIVEAKAGQGSWCGRPARLPMTGTYTATVSNRGKLRATITTAREKAGPARLSEAPATRSTPQAWDQPVEDGPADFPVDLSTGALDTQVTDLDLGGSGAADLTRSFSVGDQDLPTVAPEEPLAHDWSIGESLALEPSVSNSYLDVVLPDGHRLPYRRVTAGAPARDGAVFEPSGGIGSGPFAGSRVSYTGAGWELRTRTGTVLGFGRIGSPLRLAWIRDASGGTARFVRAPDQDDGSPDGQLVGMVSEDGQWVRLTYDAEHRVTGSTDHVGDVVHYRYARPAGVPAVLLVAATLRPVGGPRTTVGYRYQPLTARLSAVTGGHRDLVRFGYDEGGRVVRESVAAAPGVRAEEWRYSYAVGQRRVALPGRSDKISLPEVRQVVVAGPDGRRTVTFTDGHWVTDRSPSGTTRAVRQRGSGLLTSVRQSGGGGVPSSVGFGYIGDTEQPSSIQTSAGTQEVSSGPPRAEGDPGTAGGLPEGYLQGSHARGDRSAVFVDAKGRRAASRGSDGALTRVGYDAYDRPETISDPDGAVTRFGYDAAGDLASVTDPAGTTRYGWDDHGQQVSETDPLGGKQQWRHDRAGNVVRARDQRGVVSTFDYDRFGRVVVARYGVRPGRAPESRVDYTYDNVGRLASVRDSSAGTPLSLRYDRAGNLVAETTSAGTLRRQYDEAGRVTGLTLPDGVSESSEYADGRPSRLRLSDRSGSVRVAPRYDGHGRLSGLDLPHGVRGRISYSGGQVAGLTYARSARRVAEEHTTYDEAGRLHTVGGDLARPVLPKPAAASTYDAAHRTTDDSWDAAGNLLQDGTHRYRWDARGRLAGVEGPEGRTTFGYDALGRRTSATTAGKTVHYVYDGNDVVQYVASDGTRTSYLRGPDGTALAGLSNARATAYLPDTLGNVAAAVDANGNVRHFAYDPFGVPQKAPRANDPGFRGLLSDPSGQLSMGARVYDPASGRFLSRDSWGIEGGDTDPYRYALGSPTVHTDPSGHAAECVGLALGWAMSVLGPGGGWDDFDALEDKAQSGEISQDQWTVQADKVSHGIWSGFDVVANVCGTSAVGTSAAALPLLGSSKLAGRLLGSLADDAVTGAAASRVGRGLGRLEPGVSARAREVLGRLLRNHEAARYAKRGEIEGANFAQRTWSESFSEGGGFSGRTIDGVAEDLRSGTMSAQDVPIDVIIREGNMLILNTRSGLTLTRAGVPRDLWNLVDRTGQRDYERRLSAQLRRNGLDSSGIELP